MVPHLEGACVTVWETAILISIRLCLSSPSSHKSLLQSEINSYWSALITRVRHEGRAATGTTTHLSQCWKHHFVCEISTFHAKVAAPLARSLSRRYDREKWRYVEHQTSTYPVTRHWLHVQRVVCAAAKPDRGPYGLVAEHKLNPHNNLWMESPSWGMS